MLRVATCWDDGVEDDVRLAALCRTHGVPATFNLNAGLFGEERTVFWHDRGKPVARLARREVGDVYAGFDVANHGYLHLRMTELGPEAQRAEVARGRTELEALLGRETPGYCYAYGAHDATAHEAVRAAGHAYGRTVDPSDDAGAPADPMAWDPSRHFLAGDVWEEYERQRALGGTFYVWGHSYELRDEADWAALDAMFARISCDPAARWCRVLDLLSAPPDDEPLSSVEAVVEELRAVGPTVGYWVVPAPVRATVEDLERRHGPAAANELLREVRGIVCATRPDHPGVRVPDRLLADLDAQLARIRADDEPPDGLDEHCLRDLAYGLGRLVPAGLTDLELQSHPGEGFPGWGPAIQHHLSPRRSDGFWRRAWWDSYGRMAECLQANPHLRGVFASSWFYDPALRTVAPHLAHLRADLEAAGAELHEVAGDESTVEHALFGSPARRALHEQGRYVPRKFLALWPRDAVLAARPPVEVR